MPQTSRQLEVNGLPVELVRKRVKNINLSVRGTEGRVRVSAPLRVSEREIRRFVASRLDWIRQHQQRLASVVPPPEYQYQSGEAHPYLGRLYPLQISAPSRSQPRVSLNGDDVLRLYMQPHATTEQRRATLEG